MEQAITAAICTRDRPQAIVNALQTVLMNDHANFRVVVVDQSTDDATENAVASLNLAHKIHYRRSGTIGIAAARNLATRLAETELVAMTDDDCEVEPSWLRCMATSLTRDARIGLVFGNVYAGEHVAATGFIAAYVRREAFLARTLRDKGEAEGIGGCMASRRSAWRELGGFDERLGTGARFRAAEETDFAIRILLSGRYIYEDPAPRVVHHGFRDWVESRQVISDYLYGNGAMIAKHLRLNPVRMPPYLFGIARRWLLGKMPVDLGHQPPRWVRLVAFARGLGAGSLARIDRSRGTFLAGADRDN